jgi:hypothetical protein
MRIRSVSLFFVLAAWKFERASVPLCLCVSVAKLFFRYNAGMKFHTCLLIALLALSLSMNARAADAPAAKAPQMAVYRWASKPGNVDAFADWIGHEDVWGEEFTDTLTWDNVRGPGWLLDPWDKWVKAKPARRILLGIPMLVGPWDRSGASGGTIDLKKPVSLAAGAKGEYNAHYKALAESLVKHGLGESIIRLGWEFNGGWYTWRAKENPEAFAEYWRQIVKTMRAVTGAEKIQFCWNPALGYLQFPSEKAWPGADFVDYVGLDVYDDSWVKDTYPYPDGASPEEILKRQKKVWNEVLYGGDHGMKFWCDFARKQQRPFALGEWGVSNREDHHGGLDNPYFIEQMHAFITDPANNVAFHCYFDVQAPDGHHQLSPGKGGDEKIEFPKASERFKALFGRGK